MIQFNQLTFISHKKINPGAFRLFLGLVVMVFHSVYFLTIGHYAVYVFFILSGYGIFKMYNEKYSSYNKSYPTYISSKLLRIMPVYWVILPFSILVSFQIPALNDKINHNAAMIPLIYELNISVLGLALSTFQFICSAWSLDLEIQFYMLAPLILWLMKVDKWLSIYAVLLISVFILYLIYSNNKFIQLSTFFLLSPFFLIGGLLHIWKFRVKERSVSLCLTPMIIIFGINYIEPNIRVNLLNVSAKIFRFDYEELLNVILAKLTVPFVKYNINLKL